MKLKTELALKEAMEKRRKDLYDDEIVDEDEDSEGLSSEWG